MSLKRVKIQNFQSHKETELKLSPGVNVFVGKSDSGKTAIIRALRWLFTNRPSGTAFRSYWDGDTKVLVEVDDYQIVRSIGKGGGKYALIDMEGTVVDFKAFGTGVPEEILKVLNFDEVNLQGQLDAPFLLSDSAGGVAQHFNKIANLEQIDVGLKNVQSKIRILTEGVREEDNTISRLEEDLKTLEYIDKFEIDVEVLEEMENRLNTFKNLYTTLSSLLLSGDFVNKEIARHSILLPVEKELDLVLKIVDAYEKELQKHDNLESLISQLESVELLIDKENFTLEMKSSVDNVLKMYKELDEIRVQKHTLSMLLRDIRVVSNEIEIFKDDLEEWSLQFHNNFPDICPLCDQPIKKK